MLRALLRPPARRAALLVAAGCIPAQQELQQQLLPRKHTQQEEQGASGSSASRVFAEAFFGRTMQLQHWYSTSSAAGSRSSSSSSSSDDEQQQPQQQPKYRGVRLRGSTWYSAFHIPAAAIPGRDKQAKHTTSGHASPEAAARVVDLQLLALHGAAAAKRHMNFPDGSYSPEEVAAQAAAFEAKYPGIKLATLEAAAGAANGAAAAAGGAAVKLRRGGMHKNTDIVSGIKAAVQRAAQKAAAQYSDGRALLGPSKVSKGSGWRMELVRGPAKSVTRYTLYVASEMEAACAYDLAFRALYGPQFTVNFPPEMYTDSDTAAMRKDMELASPGIFEAAAEGKSARHGSFVLPPDYYTLEAGRAADAAVAAAAKAAGTFSEHGCEHVHRKSSNRQQGLVQRGGQKNKRVWSKTYATKLEAACAVDLMLLALGDPTKNLPEGVYTAEDVAAMKAWMDRMHPMQAAQAAAKEGK